MASEFSGMPLLSGPPPPLDSPRADISCRKCNKEFNVIFTRARRCNHCGFSYCSACSDYTALMPRAGAESGYDPVAVCAFCIDNLNITAGSWQYLKNLPLSRLKQYVDAYNIKTPGVLEKDDIVRSIVASRGVNGCLSPAQEDFYRKYSVPNGRHGRPRGLFSNRQAPQPAQPQGRTATSAPAFARPDLEAGVTASHPSSVPLRRQTPAYQSASTQRPHPYVPPRGPPPPPRQSGTRSANVPPSRAAQANPTPSPPPPPAIVPTLDELLAMTGDALNALSISALKAILFQNHVNARLILEKSELVSRVRALIEDERREREREAAAHAQEEAEIIARQHAMMEEHRLREEARAAAGSSPSPVSSNRSGSPGHEPTSVPSPDIEMTSSEPTGAPKHTAAAAALERSGLCVVCQDEEANIAIVDCGHMAMCRSCSELVMSSSRECPLCRTRIVTEARLLRIFKT